MENVKVQQYDPQYHQQVCALILDIQRKEFGVPITLEQQPDLNNIENFYQKGNGNFWIALYDGDVVGTIALIDIGKGEVALRKMFVAPAFRGSRFQTGQLLLDQSLDWMRETRCAAVYLGTLDIFVAAQKFYRKNGFEEVAIEHMPASFPRMPLDNRFFKKAVDGNNVKVFVYSEEYQPWFEKFNRDWIEKHFWMEPLDFQVLQHPDEHIIRKGGRIFMASCGKDVAGTVALKFVEPGVYEFTKMAVDEKFRGRSIGKALAHAAISEARALDASRIILYSNTLLQPAIELYRKLGFREIPVDGTYQRSNIKMELIL
jgi:N-acetylglutamate synthase-like GNAT family acetyltransferase